MTLANPNASHANTWWGRPSGGNEVLRVAAPMVVSSLSWTVMTFVDRMFLNWVSSDVMTGAFNASNVWFVLICLPLGMCSYANTFVAQYDGARQRERIGVVVWQAIWLALAFLPVLVAAIPFAGAIFGAARHAETIQAVEIEYFRILCLGAPAMILAQAAASFYSGRGQTQVVMWTDAAFAVVNVVLDYLWIFGYAGFPAWGVSGAAWATVVSLWLKAFAYLLLFLQPKYRATFGTLAGCRIDWKLFWRLVYFGGPSGLQMVLDVTGFTVFVMLIGRLENGAEATNMAFSISSLAFMPIYGLHLAVGVLVGERLGENRDDLAARATITTLQVGWCYMAIISLLYLFAPGLFLFGFYPDTSAMSGKDVAIYGLAVVLLRFVAAYNLLDATLMIFAGAIKGAGDTLFILRVSVVLSAVLASSTWVAVEILELNVIGCWVLVTLWVWSAAVIYAWRFIQGKWRTMRVIEDSVQTDCRAAAGLAE